MAETERLWNKQYLRAWGANFTLFFAFMLLTPLLPIYLKERFAADKDAIGMVLSGYTWLTLCTRAVSGYLVDNFPRKTILRLAWILFTAMFAGYFVAGSLLLFFVIRTLHGSPFGLTTVSNSTVAIDVLPLKRQSEGIGYYGLSNNLATATAPTVGLLVYQHLHNFDFLFGMSMFVACIGFVLTYGIKLPETTEVRQHRTPFSPRRMFLLKGWSEGLSIACYSFAYGVLVTYLAIYGQEELGIVGGSGLFFALLSFGLIVSRLTGTKGLRKGRVVENASHGVIISFFGYLLFAAVHNNLGYYGAALIIGFGNGHMFPAFQNMFINLAPVRMRGTANSTQLTAWDVGMGLGVLVGGIVAESMGYSSAFWMAWAVQGFGVVFFLLYGRKHFLRHRLR